MNSNDKNNTDNNKSWKKSILTLSTSKISTDIKTYCKNTELKTFDVGTEVSR